MNKAVVITLLLLPLNSLADGFTISRGKSTSKDKSNTKSYAYIAETSIKLPYLSEHNFTLDIDITTHFWQNYYGPDLTAASITPMINYKFYKNEWQWLVRLGIGLAYVDQTRWGNREIGDNWVFEDKLEFGVMLAQKHRMTLSLKHYSNAATNSNNDGINILSLNYSYMWQ
jgi:hypothetical protein